MVAPRAAGRSATSGWVSVTATMTARPTAAPSGRYHHSPMSRNRAISSGDRAVPSPSRTLSAVSATSRRCGLNAPAYVLIDPSVRPKPSPRLAVATSSIGKAAASVRTALLSTSSVIATVLATRPTSSTRLRPIRPANAGSDIDPAMAATTCGRKSSPYWLADRS